MKKNTRYSLVFILFLVLNCVDAQIIVKNDTISGIPLSISMDVRVNDLIEKSEEKCLRLSGTSRIDEEGYFDPSIKKPDPIRVRKPMSSADICRENPRIMGYKIQLEVVKSNEEAKQLGLDFRKRFPNIKVEIDASLRPNYKILVGSYFTKQSASEDLKKIKQYFKSAIPIQYRVFCVEAK